MPKVMVWKCPHTGKLFEQEKPYRAHLSRLGRQRREQKKLQIELEQEQAWWTQLQNTEMAIGNLPLVIVEHQKHFWAAAARHDRWDWANVGRIRKGVVMPVPELVHFEQFELQWTNQVSNTHSAPRSGVTNWSGDVTRPRGYPGWRGQVSWVVKWPEVWDGYYLGGDLFSSPICAIHTGSGGGGGRIKKGCQTFSYGITIFAADWPGPARHGEKSRMWDRLVTP